MFKNKGCLIAIFIIVILGILFFVGMDLYTDLAWFETLGVASILWKRIATEWLLFIVAWVVSSAVLVGNWWLARRFAGGGEMVVPWLRAEQSQHQTTAEPTTLVVAGRVANVLLVVIAAVLGWFFAMPARSMWRTALFNFQAVPFGQTDPILNRDLSFYIFNLPWQRFLQGWLLWLAFIAIIGAALIYVASASAAQVTAKVKIVGQKRPWLDLPPAADRHLLLLGAVILGLIAWGYQLGIPRLLYSTSGAAYGAGYTDVHARLPVMYLLTGIAALGAGILLANMFVRVRWVPYAVVGAWLAGCLSRWQRLSRPAAAICRGAQRADPRARVYRQYHRVYARRPLAWTRSSRRTLMCLRRRTPLDLAANESTIKNIRLWDYRPLLRTYGQLQEIRLYYAFTDVDVDRYQLGDDYRQVTLAAREIAHDELPETAQTWVNRHLVYTHGSGVVLSPVNEVVEEGLPEPVGARHPTPDPSIPNWPWTAPRSTMAS